MKKIILLLLSIALLTGTLCCTAYASTSTEPTVIKVGYALNYGTIKSPIAKGSEGYGYEYLTSIFEYADGDYELEFIYCEWEECKEMLESGEIDIMGPITYTEENSEKYLFTDESFGDNVIFLSTLSSNDTYYNSYDDINGSTIAVQYNDSNEYMLLEFLEENDLEAEIVYFSDNDYESVLENFGYDFCLTSSLQTLSDIVPVTTLGSTDFYYVTSTENTELMETINDGMAEIDAQEFLYQEKLYLKYYDYSIISSYLPTEEEVELIQSQEIYNVGVVNLYCPICKKDENGEFVGVVIDAMEYFAELAGIEYQLIEITDETTDEEWDSIDFSLLCLDEDLRNMSAESDTYYSMPYLLIEKSTIDEIENIGILSFYGITEVQMEDHLFGKEIVVFDNVVAMQESYNSGELDSMLITTYTLNLIRDSFNDLSFISTTIDFDLNFSFIYSEDFPNSKIAVFNKIMVQMDDAVLDASSLEHSYPTSISATNLVDYLKENPAILTFLASLIILLISMLEFRRRMQLSHILSYDELTGLDSHHKFLISAKKLIAKDKGDSYSIISFDIDNFKYINEFYGYKVGSQILNIIAQNIKGCTKSAKLIARSNADNFLLLVDKTKVMEKINDSIQHGNCLSKNLKEYIGENYDMSFSIGVYDIVDKKLDLNFMIDCANTARALGKNIAHTTFYSFTADMDATRINNNDIVANMTTAMEQQEFVLYYQPKVNLSTGKLLGVEALVRWIRNDKIIPPMNFIPLFERNGFIEEIDYYVLGKACKFINENPTSPKISVNFSSATVVKDDLVDRITAVMNQYNTPYSKIDIEITETAFIDKFEQAVEKLQKLRHLGFSISMDDFGVGISSLSRLKNIPIDTLKIDREFIVDSIENPRGGQIIKNIIQMAKDLSLETVAEGIETQEQDQLLKSLGCDIGQGYYFHRPMPEKDYLSLLQKLDF